MSDLDDRGVAAAGLSGSWSPSFPVDVLALLSPLSRGSGDPTYQADSTGLRWLAGNTPDGPASLALRRVGRGPIEGTAWGPGAERLIAGLPALLGAEDDDTEFVAHHPLVARTRARMPGLRLGATGRVWDLLLGTVLEQKITSIEAHRSWRELARRFGSPAPGPVPTGMRVPPSPAQLLAITDWQWHHAGVDGARRHTLITAARVANRLERAAELRGAEGRKLLRLIPGIGAWTAAEVAQRAWGDPDAVSVGDFHIPALVGYALTGRRLDDAGMLAELAPYAPQRHRAVRYIEASGFRKPRFGPRLGPRDYRVI
ncbi:MAG TPA: DNA-3-methyladenine glycosylase 2 family protein [Pseudonocardiaceae bacterium]|jgi:3-methyladenine DNA glycosylase/8-oxoguanine DNA glycosylase|nr:DNA-3-methyladenine glycosylase 2 family protein [Pseudonocardiaceae bacterium]